MWFSAQATSLILASIVSALIQPVAADFCWSLSSCDDALSAAENYGCTCFTCTEQSGMIHATCTAPGNETCDATWDSYGSASVYEAPPMDSRDYATICSVYIIVSLLFAVLAKTFAYYTSRSQEAGGESNVAKKMAVVDNEGKQELRDKSKGWIVEFLLKPLMPEENSFEALMEVFADLNKWAGLILIPIARKCFFKSSKTQKPRYPTKTQSFLKIIIELVVTLSLAFLLGTIVYNNEKCSSTHTVSACSSCVCDTYCNGNYYGCTDHCSCLEESDIVGCSGSHVYSCGFISSTTVLDSKVETKSLECLGADVSYSKTAQAVTVILTEVFTIATGIAVRSAQNGSYRQRTIYAIALGLAASLAAFGWFYASSVANRLADGVASDIEAARREAEARRIKAIGSVLITSWWSDQIVEFVKTAFMSAVGWVGFKMFGKPAREAGKSGQAKNSNAVIRPKLDQKISAPVSSAQQPSPAAIVGETTASDVVIEGASVHPHRAE